MLVFRKILGTYLMDDPLRKTITLPIFLRRNVSDSIIDFTNAAEYPMTKGRHIVTFWFVFVNEPTF